MEEQTLFYWPREHLLKEIQMGSVILGHVKLKEKEKEVCFLNLFQKSRIICANLKAYLLMTCDK